MSIIDNAHNSLITYDGKNKPFTGQRLAKFTWKTSTDKDSMYFGVKRESKCVSLPVLTTDIISVNLVTLAPHIASYLHGVQDKIIRERLDSSDGYIHVANNDIGIPAILEYLESSDESGRLTKESVGTWFDSNVAEMLAIRLSERLGVSAVPTDAESAKVMEAVNAFKGKIAALAGGKTSYEPKVCKSLLSAIELASDNDALALRFTARLNKMIIEAEKQVDLIDLL